MKQTIKGEAPFQVLATNFSISPSNEGYTLQISADGTNYSDLFAVGSDTTRMVTGVSNGSYFRLKGNESTVVVNWVTQCSDGGSGGGGSQYILPPATQNTLGGIKVGEGLAITNDGTLSTSGGSIDSGAVQTQIDASLNANNEKIEEGEIIAGMAKQLYSPDGVTSVGTYAYRTTAGDEDVSTGPAELRNIKGNATYPEVNYNDSAVLMRNGEEVEGFGIEFMWGDFSEWEEVPETNSPSTQDLSDYQAKQFRMDFHTTNPNFDYFHFELTDGNTVALIRFWNNGTSELYDSSYATVVETNHYRYNRNGVVMDVVIDEDWITATITEGDVYVKRFWAYDTALTREVYTTNEIPNDIPVGETSYVYEGGMVEDWTPSLPQAIAYMTLEGDDYYPDDGDEIVITRTIYANDSATYPQPDSFVALGLNSFTKDGSPINTSDSDCKIYYDATDDNGHWGGNTGFTGYTTYFVKAVTGLENGYVIHSESGKLSLGAGVSPADNYEDADNFEYGNTEVIEANKTLVVYPTTAMPYVMFSVADGDESDICVHPRWSGYRDEDYEAYEEESIDLSGFASYPLVSIGNTKNEWDVKNGKAIVRIGTMALTDENVQSLVEDGKELGVDFEIDDTKIYYILDEEQEYDVTVSYDYKANDFSVEYLTDTNDELLSIPVEVETWYMQNLVDKLRRIQGLEHIDNLNGVGNENTVYECDDRLWYWKSTSGTVAEWTDDMATLGHSKSYGLIFSNIPDGQKILEFKASWGNWRYIVMSGDTLVLTETGGTVVSSCTVGNAVQFNSQYSSSYWIKVKYEKHWIGFEIGGNVAMQNIWDGKVSGGHFGIVDHYNYPYIAGITNDAGIPRYNSKGQIIHKERGAEQSTVKFNNSNKYLLGTSNYSFDFYAPTVGGTQGQILQSNGTNAPTWIDWIKVVKITSDEYEALQTKDPNTLYVIDDESGE